MELKGSCHCEGVRFTVQSRHIYPYNRCYCSICRKTAGGGGYAINLGAVYDTLHVEGMENVSVYQARINDLNSNQTKQSPAKRHFCKHCGSALWVWDPRWPELVHPFASVIDSELPVAPQHVHMMLRSKAPWVEIEAEWEDQLFDEYPNESLAKWHQRMGLEVD